MWRQADGWASRIYDSRPQRDLSWGSYAWTSFVLTWSGCIVWCRVTPQRVLKMQLCDGVAAGLLMSSEASVALLSGTDGHDLRTFCCSNCPHLYCHHHYYYCCCFYCGVRDRDGYLIPVSGLLMKESHSVQCGSTISRGCCSSFTFTELWRKTPLLAAKALALH